MERSEGVKERGGVKNGVRKALKNV